jgi:hypothetical protein
MSFLLLSFLLDESLLLASDHLLDSLISELLLLHVIILDLSEYLINIFSLRFSVFVLFLVLKMIEVLFLLLDLLNFALILLFA